MGSVPETIVLEAGGEAVALTARTHQAAAFYRTADGARGGDARQPQEGAVLQHYGDADAAFELVASSPEPRSRSSSTQSLRCGDREAFASLDKGSPGSGSAYGGVVALTASRRGDCRAIGRLFIEVALP